MKLFIIKQSFPYGAYVFGVAAMSEKDALVYLKASDDYYNHYNEVLYVKAQFEIGEQKREGYVDKYGGFAE